MSPVKIREKEAKRISNRLYFQLKKCELMNFFPLPDFHQRTYYCGYIYAPYNIIFKIAQKLNDVIEITYPSYGLSGVKEKREKIYKVGFDTGHLRCNGTEEEAREYIDKWIEIALEAINNKNESIITRDWLKDRKCCKEGLEWFDNNYPSGEVGLFDLLNALRKEDKEEWHCWLRSRILSPKNIMIGNIFLYRYFLKYEFRSYLGMEIMAKLDEIDLRVFNYDWNKFNREDKEAIIIYWLNDLIHSFIRYSLATNIEFKKKVENETEERQREMDALIFRLLKQQGLKEVQNES